MMGGAEAILDRISKEQFHMSWEKVEMYRRVFGTPEGKKVLEDILSVLGFFSMTDKSAEEALLQSVARLLLYKCGIWHYANTGSMVDALMELEPRIDEIKEK